MLVAGTILVIAAVFTCISWNSMHPSKTVTMKELEDYASQELINQIECINGSYVVMICDEQEQASDWYALADETDQAEMEALAEKADVQIQKPEDFSACDFHYVCYTVCQSVMGLCGESGDSTGNSGLERENSITGCKEKTLCS